MHVCFSMFVLDSKACMFVLDSMFVLAFKHALESKTNTLWTFACFDLFAGVLFNGIRFFQRQCLL